MYLEEWTFGMFPAELCNWRNPIQQVILSWLWFHKNKEGTCYPSQSTLARECGISLSSVNTHLEILESSGLIIRETRFKENSKERTSTLYRLPMYSAKKSTYSATRSTGTPPNGVGTPPNGEEPKPDNQNQLEPNPITKETRCVSVIKKSEIESSIESVNERSPELAAKLSEFLEYRKAIKKPMKPVSFPAFIKKLVNDSGWSVETACAMIDESIANGWQGVFPIDSRPQKTKISSETF